ncbi:MAG: SGNH/GDSL hydrolase family protein [Clostridia bacterium]|nr:SGNH/GDSL hydrolase family protein [Clostridia bacterium]
MKIVLFGDSITDMNRDRTQDHNPFSIGMGYPFLVVDALSGQSLDKHLVINRGIGGNRVVDLRDRIEYDVWGLEPDVLSILVGVNDVWHGINSNNGTKLDEFKACYEEIIANTIKKLPNIKIMLLEPFFLVGNATKDNLDQFNKVYDYAKVVKDIAEKYNLVFIPLQEKFNSLAEKFGAKHYLYDGVHPTVLGARVIADEWLKAFKEIEE